MFLKFSSAWEIFVRIIRNSPVLVLCLCYFFCFSDKIIYHQSTPSFLRNLGMCVNKIFINFILMLIDSSGYIWLRHMMYCHVNLSWIYFTNILANVLIMLFFVFTKWNVFLRCLIENTNKFYILRILIYVFGVSEPFFIRKPWLLYFDLLLV